jgi:glutamyl-tRNA(Gln) amidotransferase subunit E
MPLIETVTYPDCLTPDELREAADCIRFINRSSGKVRTGIGAGREDVNVSCRGGTRVEIKGVSHNKWIPELSHNESFRQWALLHVKEILLERFSDSTKWQPKYKKIDPREQGLKNSFILAGFENDNSVIAALLPGFKGIISHFTQPGQCFMNELSNRLKVIACIEKPNITGVEDIDNEFDDEDAEKLSILLEAEEDDAIVVFWGPEADIPTAIETVTERCQMAFIAIPNETRKPFADGTTIFERVLPGADRMYPDTDSAPIPLDNEHIKQLGKNIQPDIASRYKQMKNWKIPEDTYNYLLKKNLVPIIETMIDKGLTGKFAGAFLGHRLKNIEGHFPAHPDFKYSLIVDMFAFLHKNKLDKSLAHVILPVIYQYPNLDFESALASIKFKRKSKDELLAPVNYLMEKFKEIKVGRRNTLQQAAENWIMGQLNKQALGNISMSELRENVNIVVSNH